MMMSSDVSKPIAATPRPLWLVLLLSIASLGVYYSWYKWTIFDELRHYRGTGLSGAQVMLPFMVGTAFPCLLYVFDPDVPAGFCGAAIVGLAWILVMQVYLYRRINQLYRQAQQPEPLRVWWVWVPGLNLLAGLQQIRALSHYWQALATSTKCVSVVSGSGASGHQTPPGCQ